MSITQIKSYLSEIELHDRIFRKKLYISKRNLKKRIIKVKELTVIDVNDSKIYKKNFLKNLFPINWEIQRK